MLKKDKSEHSICTFGQLFSIPSFSYFCVQMEAPATVDVKYPVLFLKFVLAFHEKKKSAVTVGSSGPIVQAHAMEQ